MCHADVPIGQATPTVDTAEVSIPVEGGAAEMPALLARPEGGTRPGVIVVGDFMGARSPFYEHVGSVLASAGFNALVPEYFFRQGPLAEQTKEAAFGRRGKLDDVQALADLGDAVEFLRSNGELAGERVGALGFCIGGTFVMNLAAARSDVASVAYYGFPGGTPGGTRLNAPPMDQIAELRGPLLAFWGDQDQSVPSADIARYLELHAAAGSDFEHVIYPGEGHGFLSRVDPTTGEPGGAVTDSWERTLHFLRARLAPTGVAS